MIISPIPRWKKVLARCCLTLLGGIAKLTTQTHTGSTSWFGTNFSILRFGLKTSLVEVGTSMVLIENMYNFVANITSSFSFDILEWKS
jgi:hypothetical protein